MAVGDALSIFTGGWFQTDGEVPNGIEVFTGGIWNELSTAIALDELATSGIPQNLTATFDLFPEEPDPPKKTALQAATEAAPGSTKISKEELETVERVQKKLLENTEAHKAEATRKKARKGKLTDDHIAILETAKAASKITSEDFSRLLGVHGYETQDEVKDKDFTPLLAAVKIHGGLPLK